MRLFFSLLAVIIALSSPVALAKDLKSYGADCEKIGFKPKTPAYGKCILELSREDVNSTPQQKIEKITAPEEVLQSAVESEVVEMPESGFAPPESGYITQGNLEWMPTNFMLHWDDANDFCKLKVIHKQTNWRLPSVDELSSFYRYVHNQSKELINLGWTLDTTWSSNARLVTTHYFVSLADGSVSPYGPESYENYVTCVHSNP